MAPGPTIINAAEVLALVRQVAVVVESIRWGTEQAQRIDLTCAACTRTIAVLGEDGRRIVHTFSELASAILRHQVVHHDQPLSGGAAATALDDATKEGPRSVRDQPE